MGDGEGQVLELLRAEEKRGTCATSPMPQDSPIILPQICTNSALAVSTASGAGNATLVQVRFCSAHINAYHTTELELQCTGVLRRYRA